MSRPREGDEVWMGVPERWKPISSDESSQSLSEVDAGVFRVAVKVAPATYRKISVIEIAEGSGKWLQVDFPLDNPKEDT